MTVAAMQQQSPLRVIEIGDGADRTIPIDPNGPFPVVIGRGLDANIRIGLLGKRTFVKDQQGNRVPIVSYISSVQATIHRYENGELRIHDGNCKPSANGIRIFGQQDPIKRPVPLSPGAHVELAPKKNGYGCWVEWADNSNDSGEPTLGFNRWNKALLEDDNRVLEGEKRELLERVRAIEIVNEAQDLKIKRTEQKTSRLIILGAIAVSIFAISMGISIEEIQMIVQILAIVGSAVGGGVILQGSNSS